MTKMLFRDDAYLQEASGRVVAHVDGGIVLDATNFYARSGGQPGDRGVLNWSEGQADVVDTVKGEGAEIILQLAEGPVPEVGAEVVQKLDWNHRHGCMRVHTALHLLSVVIPLGVTGGAIGAEKGRLDFMMPEPPEGKDALTVELNALIAGDLPVTESWITDAELDAQPELVKTMSVQPPRGSGKIRLVRIGEGDAQIDLQPCGGTHVRRTSEIGQVRIGKVENKGKSNRRVHLHLELG